MWLRPAHNHIDPAAAACAAHKPRVPVGDRRLGTVPLRHLGGVGFDLMAAIEAPNDQPDLAAAALPKVIGGPQGFYQHRQRPTLQPMAKVCKPGMMCLIPF
jgi:hypothetical protein